MTDINALIFALAFTMAFMLLIGAYTRIELKKEPVHIYRTRLQQAFYVVTQPTVVITTTLLLSLSWCAALDSGSFAYALLMLHGLRAKYALAINLIILLNFQLLLSAKVLTSLYELGLTLLTRYQPFLLPLFLLLN